MNNIELSAVLYYADFLSLKSTGHPVTDNCKYFFIYGVPMNSLFILDLQPVYNEEDPYFQQALVEYNIIKDKFGEDGVESFIDDICCIKACGSVNAEQMLKCIHQYSSKKERKQAFEQYYNWKNGLVYTRTTINENGKSIEQQCTKYVYHVERMLGKSELAQNVRTDIQRH